MSRLTTAQDAKEFLVAQIIDEAEREGVSLSAVERKMLYYSAVDRTLRDGTDAVDQFDSQCDSEQYEAKIANLIRHARQKARKSREETAAWLDAIRVLGKKDHYLLVMVDQAGVSCPRFDRLKLVATASALVIAGVSLLYLARRLGMDRGAVTFLVWAIAACVFAGYGLLRILLGRERTEELTDRFLGLSWRNK